MLFTLLNVIIITSLINGSLSSNKIECEEEWQGSDFKKGFICGVTKDWEVNICTIHKHELPTSEHGIKIDKGFSCVKGAMLLKVVLSRYNGMPAFYFNRSPSSNHVAIRDWYKEIHCSGYSIALLGTEGDLTKIEKLEKDFEDCEKKIKTDSSNKISDVIINSLMFTPLGSYISTLQNIVRIIKTVEELIEYDNPDFAYFTSAVMTYRKLERLCGSLEESTLQKCIDDRKSKLIENASDKIHKGCNKIIFLESNMCEGSFAIVFYNDDFRLITHYKGTCFKEHNSNPFYLFCSKGESSKIMASTFAATPDVLPDLGQLFRGKLNWKTRYLPYSRTEMTIERITEYDANLERFGHRKILFTVMKSDECLDC
jgi:hypothetical protein